MIKKDLSKEKSDGQGEGFGVMAVSNVNAGDS